MIPASSEAVINQIKCKCALNIIFTSFYGGLHQGRLHLVAGRSQAVFQPHSSPRPNLPYRQAPAIPGSPRSTCATRVAW